MALLGVQLDDEMLLNRHIIDVLPDRQAGNGPLEAVGLPGEPLGHQDHGGVLAGQALEDGGLAAGGMYFVCDAGTLSNGA